jgi:uncharacterized protein (TIGR02246 family)
MNADEQAIRSAVQAWMQASAAGDLPRVLSLMDEDVVFLGPGRPPMRGKAAFAAASQSMEGKVRIDGTSDVQEVRVFGDWAYVWTQLSIAIHATGGGAPLHRSGPGLSVWRKTAAGAWVIFRDDNMVTSEDVTAEHAKTAD